VVIIAIAANRTQTRGKLEMVSVQQESGRRAVRPTSRDR
jgi:hypothetical protein